MDGTQQNRIEAGRILRSARVRLFDEDGSLLTQREMGKKAGYSHQRISNWERGNLPANRDILLQIVRWYRIEWDDASRFLDLLSHEKLTLREWEEFGDPAEEGVSEELRIGMLVLPGVSEATLRPFEVGKLKLPIRVLVGGDGRMRYKYPDGVRCVFHARKFHLPEDVRSVYSSLLSKRRAEAEERRAPFEQRDIVRLDDFEIELSDPYETPWPLVLHVSLTDYFTRAVTNHSLDEVLPDGQLMRHKYGGDPGDLTGSRLANPLVTNLSIVTSDNWVCIADRGEKVATNPGGYAPAVSGTGNLDDFEAPYSYSPFLTARRQAQQEATGFYEPRLEEITFFGLARTLVYYDPFLFGELRVPLTWDELRSMPRQDTWDAELLLAVPLDLDHVIPFIEGIYRQMYGTGDDAYGAYSAIFSLYQSLLYRYPERWLEMMGAFEGLSL